MICVKYSGRVAEGVVKYSGREAEGIRGNSGERSSSEFVLFSYEFRKFVEAKPSDFRTRLCLSRKLRICYVLLALWTPQLLETPTNYVLRSFENLRRQSRRKFLVLLPLRVRSTSQFIH